ncbi:neutral/alkaline non-lysosomal ceramidase N-terminal domain-containing protein [uncultured Proteiniphilum sp.]|uniref:neutral/alkaline non-lysosomal ceramidase N-terminal domain-containing protein n=1 Tax=uncultured Proteiniphilum sp. TaxID=497637 RepID=UPI00261F6EEC|nr:neutral/alkaline non-lysosomal ceramidase N-terminal domain-containing protein [uncultured Proteiniphilum sp.]
MRSFTLKLCFVSLAVSSFFGMAYDGAVSNNLKPKTSEQKVFKAGAATANITPFLGGALIGEWNQPPAIEVHDELHVRCLMLDDGKTKLVFVVVDVLGLHQDLVDAAIRLISERMDIPSSNIIISAIHTHSAVSAMGTGEKRRSWDFDTFDPYQEFVIQRIVDAVQLAANHLEPARIGWGSVAVPEHVFVRRWKMKQPVINPFGEYDKVMMNPGHSNSNKLTPAAVPDPEVSFISVKSIEGRPIALLANYSLHYVGGTLKGHISADYFAVFCDHIQELLNAERQDPPFVGIMSNGTSGDINNINFSSSPEKNAPYAKMKYVGRDVAQKVFEAFGSIAYHDWVPLKAKQKEVTLKVRKPDKKMVEWAKIILARPDSIKSSHSLEKTYAERTLNQLKRPDQVSVRLHVFGIGDLGVASIPFEVFAEIGLEVKAKSPFKQTFVVGLADGYWGYLPTPAQHELGGYETWLSTNNVELKASEKIVSELSKQFSLIKSN